jgi:hypothetical protein
MEGGVQRGGADLRAVDPSWWHVRGTGDYNGDGKSDILWHSEAGGLSMWLMDGGMMTWFEGVRRSREPLAERED